MEVKSPKLLLFNETLATELGLNRTEDSQDELAQLFSGNMLPENCFPLAQAYAGHQFGHFTMLGDGRAHLLGEQVRPDGAVFDIQLKGSGPTPYSRRGDGRATVKAMLREYLISEAMHALGVPTSRSLAVVSTGEMVYREPVQPGAVLTRVMSSHIRVGSFEFAKRFLGEQALKTFAEYVIKRHYPHLEGVENPGLPLLEAIMQRQIELITNWMRIGFIHGVMNTDNMSIPGETFDYGPCAFMNAYQPATVFSSIDTQGRYAFGNQPGIAQWNLSVLAAALLPLMGENQEQCIESAKALLNTFPEKFNASWMNMMGKKIGFERLLLVDGAIVHRLLKLMQDHGADYTNTFKAIEQREFDSSSLFGHADFHQWLLDRDELLKSYNISTEKAFETMKAVNPLIIPRNHQVEAVLSAAEIGDMAPLHEFLEVIQNPYELLPNSKKYSHPPKDGDMGYQTFCGT
jgi:serine/tyrosine/threonine adenylyltransferase